MVIFSLCLHVRIKKYISFFSGGPDCTVDSYGQQSSRYIPAHLRSRKPWENDGKFLRYIWSVFSKSHDFTFQFKFLTLLLPVSLNFCGLITLRVVFELMRHIWRACVSSIIFVISQTDVLVFTAPVFHVCSPRAELSGKNWKRWPVRGNRISYGRQTLRLAKTTR